MNDFNTNSYLLLAHPVVNLLGVPVKELQVHALLILLPAELPQLQKRHFFFREYAQLHRRKWGVIQGLLTLYLQRLQL